MHARLNAGFGWTWKDESGSSGPFVLSDAYRYAGMVAGTAPNGRICARPLGEFDSLSEDGVYWKPFNELREMIPWENNVREQVVHLPDEGSGIARTILSVDLASDFLLGGGSSAGDSGEGQELVTR